MLSIENEASSPDEIDSQGVNDMLADFEDEDDVPKDQEVKAESFLKMDKNFQEVFSIMGDASKFLCDQMEAYNSTLNDHV